MSHIYVTDPIGIEYLVEGYIALADDELIITDVKVGMHHHVDGRLVAMWAPATTQDLESGHILAQAEEMLSEQCARDREIALSDDTWLRR